MSDAGTQARTGAGQVQGPDVRAPKAIAETTTSKGAQKAGLDAPVLAVLALLAGAYIAFGGLFYLLAQAGSEGMPYGAARRRCWAGWCSRSASFSFWWAGRSSSPATR